MCTSVILTLRCSTIEVDKLVIYYWSLNLVAIFVYIIDLENKNLILTESALFTVCTYAVIVAEVVAYLSLDCSI